MMRRLLQYAVWLQRKDFDGVQANGTQNSVNAGGVWGLVQCVTSMRIEIRRHRTNSARVASLPSLTGLLCI